MFYYVYRLQNLVDGSAFFGVKQTQAIDWGEGGSMWQLGIVPKTKKFQQRVAKFGMKPWRLTIYLCSTEKDLAERKINEILASVKGSPLCLNYDEEAHIAAVKENLVKATAAAAIANKDTPKTEETKKKISEGMKKKHKERKEAKATAAPKFEDAGNGQRWIHNPVTGEEMTIFTDEDLLTDFVEGRKPK